MSTCFGESTATEKLTTRKGCRQMCLRSRHFRIGFLLKLAELTLSDYLLVRKILSYDAGHFKGNFTVSVIIIISNSYKALFFNQS